MSTERRRRAAAAAIGLVLGLAGSARAQGLDDLEQRFRAATTAITRAQEAQDALLTGHEDVVLLRPTPLFNLHGTLNGQVTSNAFLDDTVTRADSFATLSAGLGASTTIAERVEVFADAGVVLTRYGQYSSLDYSALTAALGARTRWHGVWLSLSYAPSVVYDRGFGSRQLTQHRLQLAASTSFRAGPLIVQPGVFVEQVWSSPSAYENWAVGGGVSVQAPVHVLRARAFATASYQHRDYLHYFPGLLGTDRRDELLDVAAGLSWRVSAWADVTVQYDWRRNWSTSDVNRYQASTGALGVALRRSF